MLITFANSHDPDQARQTSGLILVQTVRHFNHTPEIVLENITDQTRVVLHIFPLLLVPGHNSNEDVVCDGIL